MTGHGHRTAPQATAYPHISPSQCATSSLACCMFGAAASASQSLALLSLSRCSQHQQVQLCRVLMPGCVPWVRSAAAGLAELLVHAHSALEVMKTAGMRPNRDIAYHVTNACFEAGRPELAAAYCREFDANGLSPRPLMAKRVAEAEAQLRGDASGQVIVAA